MGKTLEPSNKEYLEFLKLVFKDWNKSLNWFFIPYFGKQVRFKNKTHLGIIAYLKSQYPNNPCSEHLQSILTEGSPQLITADPATEKYINIICSLLANLMLALAVMIDAEQ